MIFTVIQADDTWALWGILAIWASVSIFLEQKYKWASFLSGAIIALAGALILSNLKIIPTESPVYDAVWAYLVPLAIPLLLFQVNMKELFQESRKLLFIFLLCAVGTVIGSIAGFLLLKDYIPELAKIAAAIGASYVGGGVNFATVAAKFEPSSQMVSATVVADNMVMALLFAVYMFVPSMKFFRKQFKTPHIQEVEAGQYGENDRHTLAEKYWAKKEISLKDVAASIPLIVEKAPLLILFVLIVGLSNLIVGLLLGKVFKIDLEHILLASNATVGGPTTASAMAIAKGWGSLVGPILVIGTLGYIIGNYIGFALGYWYLTF
ncbi:DUF819 family protein [Priestia aryabhattai]|uniref:DUF819 family protein n=1 Tax=Priestia aryabhattai TaxID=412384 RepID=UPI001C0AB317|nr:DUF819 family protein [Priestia aryabhattai]MBU3573000.1 DUF819 domain-containing protein [Priestia aryabhattai]WDL85967.1 DUF819 family protein [Priestia aryabhattai]